MQYDIEELNPVKRKIKIYVEPEEVAQIESQIIRKYQKEVQIPGFRRGKVPPGIIRQRYGESIKLDVIETAVARFYERVLDETRLNPVSQGKVTDVQFEDAHNGMEILVEVEVEPQIELRQYKGLRVEKETYAVTEEMIQEVLTNLQDRYALVKDVEESQEGHLLTCDVQQLGEGDVPIVGRKYENVTIKIGSGEFDPELEQQMVGLKVDQKTVVRKTIPLRADEEESSPRVESYEITVKAIQEKVYPELNDEFVRELNEGNYETLEDLKEAIRKNLEHDLEERSRKVLVNRLIDELLKENPFEVPESLVERYLDHFMEDLKQHMDSREINEEVFRENYRPEAIRTIRWHLIKDKIIEKERLSVTEEEIDEIIDKFNVPDDQREALRQVREYRNRVARDLRDQKVIDFLIKHAEIVEVSPSGAEATARGGEGKSEPSGRKSTQSQSRDQG